MGASIAPLRTREVVARDRFPNFRDHGRMVDIPLLRVLASLQKKHGEAFASEAGLRRMICEDVGHMPGVDTVPSALERLERRGVVQQEWLLRGGLMPDGSECRRGTRLILLVIGRARQRAAAARARARNRRIGVTRRPDWGALSTLEAARNRLAKTLEPPPGPPRERLEDVREREVGRLRELEAQWAAHAKPDKPPE
jgi:hypothetical protein